MNSNQRFPGFRRPSSDFEAVKTDLQTGLLWKEFDLSTARSIAAGTAEIVKFAGNSIYIDKAADVGNATVIFQDDSNLLPPRVFVEPGFIARVPWTRLTIENSAQPGKVLRVFYGVDVDFVPGTSAGVQISGVVDVDVQPFPYATAYSSVTPLVGGVGVLVFSIGTNANGAIIWSCDMVSVYAAATANKRSALIAFTTFPAVVNTQFPLGYTRCDSGDPGATNEAYGFSLGHPVYVPAGQGMAFLSDGNESSGYRRLLYTLL